MREIEVTSTADAPGETVRAVLDPASIIEYADTYDVVRVDTDDAGRAALELRTETDSSGPIEATFEFAELENGYTYAQRDGVGPFDEMRTWIEVEDGDHETRITARSEFTFGGPVWFVLDRLAVKYRRRELERLIGNLVADVEGRTPSE